MKVTISRLNWKLILLHSLAAWFVICAFRFFVFSYYAEFIEKTDEIGIKQTVDKFTEDSWYFTMMLAIGSLAGLLTAFIISSVIVIKNKLYWLNTLISFVTMFLLLRYKLLGFEYLKSIFLFPGKFIANTTVKYIVDGAVVLLIGLVILFSKWTNRFIITKGLRSESASASS